MIAHLRGSVMKLQPGEVHIDVTGVGYRVMVPLDVWDRLGETEQHMLWVFTYLREDRLELYGFLDRAGRTLFEELIKKPGIGPRLGLELCSVPRSMLLQAIAVQDVNILMSIKGIGKKTAEKLLLDLQSMSEKDPSMFGSAEETSLRSSAFDSDALAALTNLGYDTPRALHALKQLPSDLTTTEERVAAAVRSL